MAFDGERRNLAVRMATDRLSRHERKAIAFGTLYGTMATPEYRAEVARWVDEGGQWPMRTTGSASGPR